MARRELPKEPDRVERTLDEIKRDPELDPNIRYAFYVLHHKYCVYRAGRFLGLGRVRLAVHDWQKFTPAEWKPYVDKFYRQTSPRREDGGYDPSLQGEEFLEAFHHHIQHGKHHWQAWIHPQENGRMRSMRIPHSYVLEMVADWMGAGRSIAGTWSPIQWYQENRSRMFVHAETRNELDGILVWLLNEVGA